MCGLCGLIAEQTDWSSTQFNSLPRRQERYKRMAIINQFVKPLRVQVSDVQGVNYLVQTMTGKQAIANGLGELWGKVESLTGKKIDVLDENFLKNFVELNHV